MLPVGKTVKVTLKTPIKTFFSKGTKTLYGTLESESKIFIHMHIGFINSKKQVAKQVAVISKDLVQSIKREWLESVINGNKEWFKPTESYIPSRDDKR